MAEERYEYDISMEVEEDEAHDETQLSDLRDQLGEAGISGSQTPVCSTETEAPLSGNIFTMNEKGDVTPLSVNMDEPIRDAISRAVGDNNYHFELKNGTHLNPNTTLRQAGVHLLDTILLLPGNYDSGYNSAETSPTILSDSSEKTMKQIDEDRIESEKDLDEQLSMEMKDKGTIVITETDGNFREVSCDKRENVSEIITRAVGTSDNEEFDLFDGNRALPRTLTLRDAGIRWRSNLRLAEREINVFVRTPDARNHTILIRRSDTVETLKIRMRDRTQVPLHQQLLQYQSKPLQDDHKLKAYNIRNNSQIESACRLRGGAN